MARIPFRTVAAAGLAALLSACATVGPDFKPPVPPAAADYAMAGDQPTPQAALGEKVEPWLLLLDPASPDGYVRDWQPPGLSPLRHWSYAIQWWGFAVTLVIIWAIMSARRPEPKI